MYRPIPELYSRKVDRSNLISTKMRTVPILGMTHFAPVTIATRPCKSSRSRSGEIFDVALPMGGKLERQAVSHIRWCILWGCMNYDNLPGAEFIRMEFYPLQDSFRSGAELKANCNTEKMYPPH